MSISPASDLILDVARAADPQKAAATTRALATAGNEQLQGADFANALDQTATAWRSTRDFSYQNPIASKNSVQSAASKAAVGLESVLLKSFVDQMLPKDAVEVFGSGVAGDCWKSMLAEKIANEMARSGALKLASRLFETHPDLLHSSKQASPAQSGAQASANSASTSKS